VSGRESFGSVSMQAGHGARVDCHTYDRAGPILSVSAGRLIVNISIAGRRAMPAHAVTFAQELAAQAAVFAAECERLHAAQLAQIAAGASTTVQAGDQASAAASRSAA